MPGLVLKLLIFQCWRPLAVSLLVFLPGSRRSLSREASRKGTSSVLAETRPQFGSRAATAGATLLSTVGLGRLAASRSRPSWGVKSQAIGQSALEFVLITFGYVIAAITIVIALIRHYVAVAAPRLAQSQHCLENRVRKLFFRADGSARV